MVEKKSGMRRWISCLLAVCLLAGMFPAAAFAAGSNVVTYPVTGGNIYFNKSTGAVTDCDESVTEAVIPEEIEGVAVTEIGKDVFFGCGSLESVVIPEGVTKIGQYAFALCSSLRDIEIPEAMTEIEKYAFFRCFSLKSIEIPEGVTEIGDYAFSGCSSLKTAGPTGSGCDYEFGWTEKIPDYAFSCSGVKSIRLPEGVTEIGESAFDGCSSLKSIQIPEGVTKIARYAFHRCTDLESVELPEGITWIGWYAFFQCSSLNNIKIPEKVTKIEYAAFAECDSLTDIYYAGSEEQWSKISIENANDDLTDAAIHYNSAESDDSDSGIKAEFEGHVYQVFDDSMTWEEANSLCAEKGGYLATITSEEEQNFLMNLLQSHTKNFYWIGGTDSEKEGTWKWITGEEWTYENWLSGQPDNHSDTDNRSEDYLALERLKKGWNDLQNAGDSSGSSKITNGGYICEWGDIESEKASYTLVDAVRQYTSEYDVYLLNTLLLELEDADEDLKMKIVAEAFHLNGIMDIHEGITYINNAKKKQIAYNALINDDMYTANNFYQYVENNPVVKAVLLASSLVFSGEINDYLSFDTYLESDYPGVVKYEKMFLDFMNVTQENIEMVDAVNLAEELLKNTTEAAQQVVMAKLGSCESYAEMMEYLESEGFRDVLLDTGKFSVTADGAVKVDEIAFSETSGFGQFAKAVGKADTAFSAVNLTLTQILDFSQLDSKLALYQQYEGFLTDVVNARDSLPFEMRWAAQKILDDMEGGVWAQIRQSAVQIFDFIADEGGLTKAAYESFCGSKGVSTINGYLTAINVASWFINQAVDVGAMVEASAVTQGYAILGNYYKGRLMASADAFRAAETEENAWNFYYNYVTLWNLRCAGEKAYLDMNKMDGLLAFLLESQYQMKEEFVTENLERLETYRFVLTDDTDEETEAKLYQEKKIIECPVDVEVYDRSGNLIVTMKDGAESDVTNEYGRFVVVYRSLTGEYAKILYLNEAGSCDLKLNSVEDGLVSYTSAKAENTESIGFANIPAEKGDRIEIKADEEQNAVRISALESGEEPTETLISLEPVAAGQEKEDVTGITMQETAELQPGESLILSPVITPSDATYKSVQWFSSDESIADVRSGVVTAKSTGSAVIICVTDDGSFKAECRITVGDDGEYAIRSLQLLDDDGQSLDNIPSGGFYVNAELSKAEEAGDAVIVLAAYDRNGKMLRLYCEHPDRAETSESEVTESDTAGDISSDIYVENPDGNVAEIRVFVLRSLGIPVSLCPSVSVG